ncbi:MAG: L,D-transpeptidase family protein [Candidatus Zixiibacteriota bacterium]
MRYFRQATLLLLVLSALVFLFAGCEKPPTLSLENARQALRLAEDAGALRYAEIIYRDAEQLVNTGWMAMARENGKLAPFRNYDNADSILAMAYRRADEARVKAIDSIETARASSQTSFAELSAELEEWNEALNGSLDNFNTRDDWQRAHINLDMAHKLMANGEFDEARISMLKARNFLKQVGAALESHQQDESRQISTWRRWVSETLELSRRADSYVVIVDKVAHKTYLVKGGKLLRTYDSELGYNSSRQKLFSGDAATPEGKYRVVKQNNRSKFYRALLLDYPNDFDRKRFADNKRRGVISKRARIGGWIEIHGDGGKNRDWTEGCVALTNKDMDHIMKFVSVGTPVTIVRKSDQWP